MPSTLRHLAARTVKPRVSEETWNRLRRLGGSAPATTPSNGASNPKAERRARLAAMNLTELALEFKTDKAGSHNYTPHYERHLQHLRDQQFTLLEIGIGVDTGRRKAGASLRMWKHFFPKASIIGLDIEDRSSLDQKRIRTYQGSQADEELLRRIVAEAGSIEVIIDDGSHRSEHIRESFRVLFPLLADGGIYVIEDTQTSYWPRWGGDTDRHARHTSMALVKDLVDGLNYAEYLDEDYEPTYSDLHVVGVHAYHNLVFIEKGDNDERSNIRRK